MCIDSSRHDVRATNLVQICLHIMWLRNDHFLAALLEDKGYRAIGEPQLIPQESGGYQRFVIVAIIFALFCMTTLKLR